jgi:hypothetical protein
MADQAVLKYLSIDTFFDPCYLLLDSTFKSSVVFAGENSVRGIGRRDSRRDKGDGGAS